MKEKIEIDATVADKSSSYEPLALQKAKRTSHLEKTNTRSQTVMTALEKGNNESAAGIRPPTLMMMTPMSLGRYTGMAGAVSETYEGRALEHLAQEQACQERLIAHL